MTERDAWLREALRHAPDAGALPPPEVREAILAEARAATAAQRSASVPGRRAAGAAAVNWFLAFWDRLSRAPIATGFAGVMATTLVGLMWWDRPLDEALPRPPAAQVEPAPAAASEQTPRLDPAARQPSRREAPAPFPGVETEARATANGAPTARAERLDGARRAPARAADDADRAEPPAAPAPAPAKVTPATAEAAQAAAEAAPRPTEGSAAPTLARRDRLAQIAPAEIAASPLASLRGSIAAEAPRWSRRTAGGEQAVDAAAQGWLADVDAAAAGRWQPLADAGGEAGFAAAPAAGDEPTLVLSRDGRPAALVRIDGPTITLESRRDGRARRWQATLEESAARRLVSSLPR